MAHDIFISHSSRDKAIADSMCATLESQNIRCWIAPRDVPPGQTWPVALVEAIGNSHVFVLILSNGSNNSAQVLREVGEALDKGIPVIPFRIDDVIPSKEMGYYLRGIHWLDALTPPLERHLKSLATTLKALLSTQQAERLPSGVLPTRSLEEEPAGASTRSFPRSRLPLQILLALAGGLLLAGVIFLAIAGKINIPSSPSPPVQTTAPVNNPGETLTVGQAVSPSTSGASAPTGSQMPSGTMGQNWIQIHSFPAPGNAPTGIVRIGDTLWVSVPCDNSIYHLTLDGNLISEIEMPEPGCGPREVGLAWDGTSLWGTWWVDVIQIDPDSGLIISTFPADLDGRGIAWDGFSLWIADREGNLSVYDLNGTRQRHLAVPVFGMLSGITWANGELWVLDEFGTITLFDQDLNKIESFSLSAGCGISSFHQQMAVGLYWDGASLWVADAINDRIYECAPGN